MCSFALRAVVHRGWVAPPPGPELSVAAGASWSPEAAKGLPRSIVNGVSELIADLPTEAGLSRRTVLASAADSQAATEIGGHRKFTIEPDAPSDRDGRDHACTCRPSPIASGSLVAPRQSNGAPATFQEFI